MIINVEISTFGVRGGGGVGEPEWGKSGSARSPPLGARAGGGLVNLNGAGAYLRL